MTPPSFLPRTRSFDPVSYLDANGGLRPDAPAIFDAVRVVRRIFNERRVGHAGTLDPTASSATEGAAVPAGPASAASTGPSGS